MEGIDTLFEDLKLLDDTMSDMEGMVVCLVGQMRVIGEYVEEQRDIIRRIEDE